MDTDDSIESVAQQLIAISRIAWSGDTRAASKACAASRIAASHLSIAAGRVCIRDSQAFERELAHSRLAALEARDVARARPHGKARRPRRRAAVARLAQLWSPNAARLVLRGLRTQNSSGDSEVVTSASRMHEVVADHWAPVFQAPDVSQDAVDDLVRTWMPRWKYTMRAPNEEQFARALSRGRRSAFPARTACHTTHGGPRRPLRRAPSFSCMTSWPMGAFRRAI